MITKLVPTEIKRVNSLINEFCNGTNSVRDIPFLLMSVRPSDDWSNAISTLLDYQQLNVTEILDRKLTATDFDATLKAGKLTLRIKIDEYTYLLSNYEKYEFSHAVPNVLNTPHLRDVRFVSRQQDDAVICSMVVNHPEELRSQIHLVAVNLYVSQEYFEVNDEGMTIVKDGEALLTSKSDGLWCIETTSQVLIELALREHLHQLHEHAISEDLLLSEIMQRCYSLRLTGLEFGYENEYYGRLKTLHVSKEVYDIFVKKVMKLYKHHK